MDNVKETWTCSKLLSFSGAAYSSCTWRSSKCVEIVFCGNSLCADVDRAALSLIVPGERLTLRANSTKAACFQGKCTKELDDDFLGADPLIYDCTKCPTLQNEEHSVVVGAPAVPLLPKVYLSASVVDGLCRTDNLTIDASSSFGSGGRPWKKIEWVVTVSKNNSLISNSNTRAIESYLNGFKSINSPIEIPFSMLDDSVYTYTLRLANFFQSDSSTPSYSSVLVDATVTLPIPTITFDSSSFQQVKAYDELAISVRVSLPSCFPASALSYRWKVYKELEYLPGIQSTSSDPQRMVLDPYALEPGATYFFQVIATTVVGSKGSATVTVFVEESSVYVAISGPSSIKLPYNESLDLDASTSLVKDKVPDNTNEVLLSWTCFVSATAESSLVQFGDDCDDLFDMDSLDDVSSRTMVPIKTHLMEASVEYSFSASSISESDVLGSDTVVVSVADSAFSLLPRVSISSTFSKFNANSILQILGDITPAVWSGEVANCSWSIEDDTGNAVTVDSTTRLQKLISFSTSTPAVYAFSAKPFSFVTGKTYVFQLQASLSLYSDASAITFASLTATANGPPTSGLLELSPMSGDSFKTRFLFSALYWVEDNSDYPISYIFRYSLLSNSSVFLLELSVSGVGISALVFEVNASSWIFQLEQHVDVFCASVRHFSVQLPKSEFLSSFETHLHT